MIKFYTIFYPRLSQVTDMFCVIIIKTQGNRMKYFLILLLFVVSLFAKININTATMQELHSLKGIGHKKAVAIIKYRKKHPFDNIEDIIKVKGIGKKTFEKIRNDICVDDEE